MAVISKLEQEVLHCQGATERARGGSSQDKNAECMKIRAVAYLTPFAMVTLPSVHAAVKRSAISKVSILLQI